MELPINKYKRRQKVQQLRELRCPRVLLKGSSLIRFASETGSRSFGEVFER